MRDDAVSCEVDPIGAGGAGHSQPISQRTNKGLRRFFVEGWGELGVLLEHGEPSAEILGTRWKARATEVKLGFPRPNARGALMPSDAMGVGHRFASLARHRICVVEAPVASLAVGVAQRRTASVRVMPECALLPGDRVDVAFAVDLASAATGVGQARVWRTRQPCDHFAPCQACATGVIHSEEEESLPEMAGAGVRRTKHRPLRMEPDLGQRSEDGVENGNDAWDVLQDDASRSYLAKDVGNFRPDPAVVFFVAPTPRSRVRLAGKTGRNRETVASRNPP